MRAEGMSVCEIADSVSQNASAIKTKLCRWQNRMRKNNPECGLKPAKSIVERSPVVKEDYSKPCSKCKVIKHISEFTERDRNRRPGEYKAQCKTCLNEYQKAYAKEHYSKRGKGQRLSTAG